MVTAEMYDTMLVTGNCAGTSEFLKYEIKCKTFFPSFPKHHPRPSLCRCQLEFYQLNFVLCFNAWKVGPSIHEGTRAARISWLMRLITFIVVNTYRALTMVQEECSMSACIIISVSPPRYPNIIISITGIKSEPQTLCPRSVSRQQSRDSHLDLADNKTWTFDYDTVFFHEVCPGSLPSVPLISHLYRCFFPPLGPDPAPTQNIFLGASRHQLGC